MITRTFDIVIRIPQIEAPATIFEVVQNDNAVYSLSIRITDGLDNDIDYQEVSTATVTFEKSDKNVVQGELTPTPTGTGYIYNMGTNEIAYPGKVIASIQLLGADGERLTTAMFCFKVVRDLITPSTVQSTTEYLILQQLIKDVKALAEVVTPEDFGAAGNARYLFDGTWYSDEAHTIPAQDDTEAFASLIEYAAGHPDKDIGVTRGAVYLLDFDAFDALDYRRCLRVVMGAEDGSSLPSVSAWLHKVIEDETAYTPAWIAGR